MYLEENILINYNFMKKIITIAGSNSKNSINKMLVEYAGSFLQNTEVLSIDLNNFEMPLFSVDVENENGFPQSAIKLNELIESADGFIISLAEHNGAYAAVFKNTFDWLSRIEAKVWRNKPVLLLATSPGVRGGLSVLEIALARFPYHGAKIIGSMSVPSFYDNFTNSELDNALKSTLHLLVQKFENSL